MEKLMGPGIPEICRTKEKHYGLEKESGNEIQPQGCGGFLPGMAKEHVSVMSVMIHRGKRFIA